MVNNTYDSGETISNILFTVFERFSFENLRDFLWNTLNLLSFELKKMLFCLKQVRILAEIDQSDNNYT